MTGRVCSSYTSRRFAMISGVSSARRSAVARPVERLGLRDRARESVEQHTRRWRDILELRAHHTDRHVVGNVFTALEITPHTPSEVGPPADVVAEDLAGRELDPPILLGERLGLRPLPHPGWTHDDQVPTGAADARGVSG